MTQIGKFPGPVVGAGAGLHPDQAGWQLCNKLHELGTRYFWAYEGGFACLIDAMHSENVQVLARSMPTVTIAMTSPSKKVSL